MNNERLIKLKKMLDKPIVMKVINILMLGFAAGLPFSLIFSTLSLWLSEAGVEHRTITMFSWAALCYSFKFVWSPLIDSLPLPVLSRVLGKRRGWLLFAQCLMIFAILLMAFTEPNPTITASLYMMAAGSVLLGFSAATQDVVIDAYRIEIAPDDSATQSALSVSYTIGYRIGMIVSGAGSLLLATNLGSSSKHYVYEAWRTTYFLMAAIMGLCLLTTLLMKEPEVNQNHQSTLSAHDNLRLLIVFILSVVSFIAVLYVLSLVDGALSVSTLLQNWFPAFLLPVLYFIYEALRLLIALMMAGVVCAVVVRFGVVDKRIVMNTWVEPIRDFFHRYGKKAIVLLALIGLYRISDIVMGVISNLFYSDMGFSKPDIAWAGKTFGVWMSILGGFAGGLLAQKFRIMNMMILGAVLAAVTNLSFIILATPGRHIYLMYAVVGLDNFAAGLASMVFVVFLSMLTNIRFTAVQYALFSSLMTLLPKILGGYSGIIVKEIGYIHFFEFSALLSVPILGLIWWADRVLFQEQ